jgi:hypothetical protein
VLAWLEEGGVNAVKAVEEAGVPKKALLWRGCRSAFASALVPFWSPVPRPRLRPPWPPGGGGVGFPLRGGVWAE